MDWVGALCAFVAGSILIVSGVLKLGRHDKLLIAMHQLEVPKSLRTALIAKAVPLAEIAIGAGMLVLPSPAFVIAACAAVVLYAAFLVVVTVAVRNNRTASCDCFGSLSTKPVSTRTVARNTVLLAIAIVAAALTTAPAAQLTAAHRPGFLWCVPLVVAALAAVGLRGYEFARERRERAALIKSLQLFDRNGEPIALTEFQDPATVLVFMSATCGSCHDVVGHLRWWPNALPDDLDVQPVFSGTPEQFEPHEVFAPLLDHAWYDHDYVVGRAIAPSFTPAAVIVDRDNPLGRDLVSGLANIQNLVVRPGFWDEPEQRELLRANHDDTDHED